jgi:hypothetical protein
MINKTRFRSTSFVAAEVDHDQEEARFFEKNTPMPSTSRRRNRSSTRSGTGAELGLDPDTNRPLFLDRLPNLTDVAE